MIQVNESAGSSVFALKKFVDALSVATTAEQVFLLALAAIRDVLKPDHAYVSMEPGEAAPSKIVLPVHAGQQLLGFFILDYEYPRPISKVDVELAEIIAMQAGLTIDGLQTRHRKAEMVAMAVHELRSPLNSIMAASLLVGAGKAIPRAFIMIHRNARLQQKLIDELLAISQVDAGRIELQWTSLDLTPLLTDLIEDLQIVAAADGTVIHSRLNGPLMVRGDAQRLHQIFSNLIGNSIRSVPPNGEIHVNAEVIDGFVQVAISDNGIGISPEHLPYIFERFRQVRPPEQSSGLGLGLAIVHELVAMHRGTVVANSAGLGKGANFCVRLAAE